MSSSDTSWQGWAESWHSSALHDRDFWEEQPEFDYSDVDPTTAGQEFTSMLVHLKLKGVLSAKQTCVLAYWSSRAGAVGDAFALGSAPRPTIWTV